jgi:hypothetical protein
MSFHQSMDAVKSGLNSALSGTRDFFSTTKVSFVDGVNSYLASKSYREDMEELIRSLDRFFKEKDRFNTENKSGEVNKIFINRLVLALIGNSFKRAALGTASGDPQIIFAMAGEGALEVVVVITYAAGKIILKRFINGIESDSIDLVPV